MVLRKRYFNVRSKGGKSQILDEYYRNTRQSRKYVIAKIHRMDLRPGKGRRGRRHMMVKLKLPYLGCLLQYKMSLGMRRLRYTGNTHGMVSKDTDLA